MLAWGFLTKLRGKETERQKKWAKKGYPRIAGFYRGRAKQVRKQNLHAINMFDADILGRPSLAKRVLAKEKDSATRAKVMEIANLPFISGKEVLEKELPFPEKNGLKKMPRARIFSTEEVEILRRMLNLANTREKSQEVRKIIMELLSEKEKIARLAAEEPVLTTMVLKEVLPILQSSPGARGKAAAIIELASEKGFFELTIGGSKKPLIIFTFSREENGKWKMRKVVNDKPRV